MKESQKSEMITIRLTPKEANSLKKEAATELLSVSSLLRRKLFFNALKATV
jgi:hypothetical protein